jgi:hypothetical protein
VAETSPSSVKEKPAMILNRDDKTSEKEREEKKKTKKGK